MLLTLFFNMSSDSRKCFGKGVHGTEGEKVASRLHAMILYNLAKHRPNMEMPKELIDLVEWVSFVNKPGDGFKIRIRMIHSILVKIFTIDDVFTFNPLNDEEVFEKVADGDEYFEPKYPAVRINLEPFVKLFVVLFGSVEKVDVQNLGRLLFPQNPLIAGYFFTTSVSVYEFMLVMGSTIREDDIRLVLNGVKTITEVMMTEFRLTISEPMLENVGRFIGSLFDALNKITKGKADCYKSVDITRLSSTVPFVVVADIFRFGPKVTMDQPKRLLEAKDWLELRTEEGRFHMTIENILENDLAWITGVY